MLHRIRIILVWILGKIIPPIYFDVFINESHINESKAKMLIGVGSILRESSIIHNLQDLPKKIVVGEGSVIEAELLIFRYGGQIVIGDNTFIGKGSFIWSGESISIGNNVLISHQVHISDSTVHETHHLERASGFKRLVQAEHSSMKGSIATAPIIIEDYAWINPHCVILKGVHIGKGAIIGAGSVVTSDVAPFTLVAGNPAKFIKELEHD